MRDNIRKRTFRKGHNTHEKKNAAFVIRYWKPMVGNVNVAVTRHMNFSRSIISTAVEVRIKKQWEVAEHLFIAGFDSKASPKTGFVFFVLTATDHTAHMAIAPTRNEAEAKEDARRWYRMAVAK